MKKLILGYGVSGKSAARFLKAKGDEYIVVDRNAKGGFLDRADFPLVDIDQVILSPGISPEHPIVMRARRLQIEVIGEMELGMRHLTNRAIGVTGTNGKTSTTLLIEHLLKSSKIKVRTLGNIGVGLTSYLIDPNPDELLILELSSFQLETIQTAKLELCFVLNIWPNHLDRYACFSDYVAAKARVWRCLAPNGELFVSDQVFREFKEFTNAKKFENSLAGIQELRYTKFKMPSKQSIEAAYLLCKRCGVSDVEFLNHLRSFRKLPHRIEWVDKIAGVSYYNDSKSSNVQSVIHAVEGFIGPLILIVGGVHKGSSYKPWIGALKKKVRKMICYGEAAAIIECELKNHFSIQVVDRFEDAIKLARKKAQPLDTVLLSPGCSSFDQFKSYRHRGNEFKRLVREV